jgi:hypothetical protein
VEPIATMKYTIVFPIPVSQKDEFTYLIPTGFYRDVATQLKVTTVRMLCMTGTNPPTLHRRGVSGTRPSEFSLVD